jgi:DNA-binding NarL/FixJ family response regulator
MTIRVLLVDDQPLIRSGLRTLMDAEPDLDVVGEAGTGGDAIHLAQRLRPDVAVMDVRMPGMDGIAATAAITAAGGPTRVLVLTTFDEDEHIYGALRAGAAGFLVKDTALEDIITAVRVVAAGDALLAPGVTRRLIAEFAQRPQRYGRSHPTLLDGVTQREREVLTLVGRGLTNAEIAAELSISAATAKAHVARLFTKLDARDRVQLVIVAYETGLVSA